jgi:hypothetical protein
MRNNFPREESIILDVGWPKLDYLVTVRPKKMLPRMRQHLLANKSLFMENRADLSYMGRVCQEAVLFS